MFWEDHKCKLLMPAGSAASQWEPGEGEPAAPLVWAILKFLCGIKTALHTKQKTLERDNKKPPVSKLILFCFAEFNQILITV